MNVNSLFSLINKNRTFSSALAAVAVFGVLILTASLKPYNSPNTGLTRVVIDAGHGGKDPGAIGVNGLQEKDVALYTTLKLGKLIQENYDDVEVIYTRDTDEFIGLYDRANLANGKDADLFISIHANAAASTAARGTETFVLGLHRNEANLEVAKRENASIMLEEDYQVRYDGFNPNSAEDYIALTIMQSEYLNQSLTIASKIQDNFTSQGRYNRGVKQAGFLVLYKTTMPSILIELGFVTHKDEGKFLANNGNLDKMANGIFKAFKEYKAEVDGRSHLMTTHNHTGPKETTVAEQDIHFRVQLASSNKAIPLKSQNFKGLKGVEQLKVDGGYKYTVGRYTSFEDGLKKQREVRESAYKDAFLIALEKGERIPISEALEKLKTP